MSTPKGTHSAGACLRCRRHFYHPEYKFCPVCGRPLARGAELKLDNCRRRKIKQAAYYAEKRNDALIEAIKAAESAESEPVLIDELIVGGQRLADIIRNTI